ncbi:Arylsulfatase A [Clostridium grantii DSM 8605]|uniref:Arylsulfatase A n=2 Tax=Clostridium TaxID=1485 RepID=A0A1M5U1Z0_9CLOT|nr:Arylsulfatase A [Clostridium grantii DSM 8605]
MCVPSRVSIATGRHALSHGALDNMLRPLDNEVSMYSILQNQGYFTLNQGKWHCNIEPAKFGMSSSNERIYKTNNPENYVTCFGITDPELRKKTEYKRNYGEIPLIISGTRPSHKDDTMDSIVTKNYLNDLDNISADRLPIFARLSIMDPHTPYIPSEPYASMYKPSELPMPNSINENLNTKPVLQRYFHEVRGFNLLNEEDYRKCKASYYGLVTHVDDRVGQVIDKLKSLDLYEDSLIIFTSDHGSMLGEHGYVEKWGHMYEQVMKTPLLIKFPKNKYKGKRMDSFVESIDVMPTILDILKLDIPNSVQGKSLMPYIEDKSESHKNEVYAQYYCGALQNESALMVKDAKWKFTYYPEGNVIENKLMNDHRMKMTGFFDGEEVFGELYDIINDPEEINNLFDNSSYQEIKQTYMNKLEKWKKELGLTVETHTMKEKNDLSLHVVTQGENMKAAQDLFRGEGRLRQLKLKEN